MVQQACSVDYSLYGGVLRELRPFVTPLATQVFAIGAGMGDSDDEDGDAGAPVKNLVASCTELKAGGNEHFKAGRCDEAVTEYWKAVLKLTSGPAKKALAEFYKASPDSPDTASPLLASLHGNMAACHVKSSQWVSAISAASEALRLEPDNLKARRAPRSHAIRMPCTRRARMPCACRACTVKAAHSSTPSRQGALPARARLQPRRPERRGQGRPDRSGTRRPHQPRGAEAARGRQHRAQAAQALRTPTSN